MYIKVNYHPVIKWLFINSCVPIENISIEYKNQSLQSHTKFLAQPLIM